MAYGIVKITSDDALKHILEVLHDHLKKQSAFSNNSIGYYAIKMKYKVDLVLYARAVTEEHVQGMEQYVPEGGRVEDVVKDVLDGGTVGVEASVEGEVSAGRVPHRLVTQEHTTQEGRKAEADTVEARHVAGNAGNEGLVGGAVEPVVTAPGTEAAGAETDKPVGVGATGGGTKGDEQPSSPNRGRGGTSGSHRHKSPVG